MLYWHAMKNSVIFSIIALLSPFIIACGPVYQRQSTVLDAPESLDPKAQTPARATPQDNGTGWDSPPSRNWSATQEDASPMDEDFELAPAPDEAPADDTGLTEEE
mgnify:FL=1